MSIYLGLEYLHILFPFGEIYQHLILISFSPIFQSCSSQVPDHLVNPLTMAYEPLSSYMSGHFSFQTKCLAMCTAQSSVHIEGSAVYFRVVPERDCNAAAVHFWVVPASCAEPSVNSALVVSSSANQSQGTPHGALCECLASAALLIGVEATGIWATSSCNLLVPAGPLGLTSDNRPLLCTSHFMTWCVG